MNIFYIIKVNRYNKDKYFYIIFIFIYFLYKKNVH